MSPKWSPLGLLVWRLGMAFCLFGPTCYLMAQPTLRITSLSEGAIVNAGQVLTVTVEASPPNAFKGVFLVGEDPIGFSQPLERPPYKFTLPIPLHITPRRDGYMITPDGILAPGQAATSLPVSIHVERSDVPITLIPGDYYLNSGVYPSSTSMHVYRSLQLSKVGWAEMLYVLGIFPDQEQVDLSESSYLRYSSDNPGVAKVDQRGTVLATGIGSARITITYRSKSVIVPVTVSEGR
jgi:hypothetical protein